MKYHVVEGPPGCIWPKLKPNKWGYKGQSSAPGGTVYTIDENGNAKVVASYTGTMERAKRIAALLEAAE